MPDPRQRPPGTSSPARYAVVFVIGLAAGAFLLVAALRAVEARRGWEDHYPKAVMRLSQAHMAQLGNALAETRCAPGDSRPHIRALRALADDLEPAFPDLRGHRGFVTHAQSARTTLDASLAALPTDCPGLQSAIRTIDDSCRACHQDMRLQ